MKTLLTTLLLLAFAGISQAQDYSFGPKLGLNTSTINGDDAGDFDLKFGPAFGAFGKVFISDNFSFQPEILYNAYGANSSESDDDLIRFNQISIPATINFYPGFDGNETGFKIGLGPQIGFYLKDEIEQAGEKEDFSDIIETFPTQDFATTDIGGLLKLGYEFQNGLWVEGVGFHSLSPVFQINDDKNFNSAGTFTIGYNIPYSVGL
ncbi:MAG: PorT family protein [Saprospiraceae bacterium]|nr:PorT family protein [Saprospiraceae bacterium]